MVQIKTVKKKKRSQKRKKTAAQKVVTRILKDMVSKIEWTSLARFKAKGLRKFP